MIKFTPFPDTTLAQRKMIWQWRNHPEVRRWMYNRQMIPLENHLAFVESLATRTDRKYWLVTDDAQDIGVIDVHMNDDGRNEFGYYQNPDIHGVGFTLVKEGLHFVLHEQGMESVFLSVDKSNWRAIALDTFVGFVFSKEETVDGATYVVSEDMNGEVIDSHYHLTDTDYRAYIKKIKEQNNNG